MAKNNYIILLIISMICNVILAALLLKPLPKEEQELVNFFRDIKENQESVLPQEKTDEIKQISKSMIIDISRNWDVETIKSLFSQEVLSQIGEEKIPKLLKMFSRLGKFEKLLLPESIGTVPGQPNLWNFTSNAKFENGQGYVTLILENKGDNWQLMRFNINSEAFLN